MMLFKKALSLNNVHKNRLNKFHYTNENYYFTLLGERFNILFVKYFK